MDGAVGFIGLGQMGAGMASNLQQYLQKQGKQLHVYNRSKHKAKELLDQGCIWSESPAEIAELPAAVVFSMLAEDNALHAVFSDFLKGNPPSGTIYVDCSTVLPSTIEELAKAAQEKGVTFMSCPVFGRPSAARGRQLIVVASGPAAAKAKIRPLQEALGKAVIDVGDSPRLGVVMKLVGNFFIASVIEVLSQGMTLGDKNGLPRENLLEFLSYMFPGAVYEGYGSRIAKDEFEMSADGGFTVDLAIKDASHMKQLADESGVPLPMVETLLQHLRTAQQKGRGDLDWGAVATVVRDSAGDVGK